VNEAFEELTGFSFADSVGQNCRFLQGEDTEQEAVAEMIYALQNAESCEVQVTNYRKDGTPFQNLVRLEPIRDSAGEYRYMVGVQYDKKADSADTLRARATHVNYLAQAFRQHLLPFRELPPESDNEASRSGGVRFSEDPSGSPGSNSGDSTRTRKIQNSLVAFSKLAWQSSPEESLETLLSRPNFGESYVRFLKLEYNEAQLELVLAARELEAVPNAEQEERAEDIFADYLCPLGFRRHAGQVTKQVRDEAANMMKTLAQDSFPRFLASVESADAVEAVVNEGSAMAA